MTICSVNNIDCRINKRPTGFDDIKDLLSPNDYLYVSNIIDGFENTFHFVHVFVGLIHAWTCVFEKRVQYMHYAYELVPSLMH